MEHREQSETKLKKDFVHEITCWRTHEEDAISRQILSNPLANRDYVPDFSRSGERSTAGGSTSAPRIECDSSETPISKTSCYALCEALATAKNGVRVHQHNHQIASTPGGIGFCRWWWRLENSSVKLDPIGTLNSTKLCSATTFCRNRIAHFQRKTKNLSGGFEFGCKFGKTFRESTSLLKLRDM